MTSYGENTSPAWSPDSSHIVFISRNRSSHKNAQAYELDLSNSKERRITYSDGDVAGPEYVLNGQKIIYASTTDELKERPLLLTKSDPLDPANPEPPSDLYLSDVSGIEITRLTNHPGFDGRIRLSGVRDNEFYFSSSKDQTLQTYKFNLLTKAVTPVFLNSVEKNTEKSQEKSQSLKAPPVIQQNLSSLNNRFAWLQITPEPDGKQQLMLAVGSLKNAKPADYDNAKIQDLSWIAGAKPGEEKLLLTQTSKDNPRSHVVVFDPQKNCSTLLLSGDKFQITQPRLSPDQKRIVFVSDQSDGLPQLMTKWIEPKNLECTPAVAPTLAPAATPASSSRPN